MAEVPARPKTVPPQAVWSADDGEWELGARDAAGERTGPHQFWRPDGTLCNEVSFKAGRPHGSFKRYHNNGEISQKGRFVEGRLHGTRRWFACDAPTDEETAGPGLSARVCRSEMDYDHGRVIAVRHFDADGVRVQPSGEPYPERPAKVPDQAEYRPGDGWVLPTLDARGRRHGPFRRWDEEGALAEECEFARGRRHGPSARFHPNGRKAEEGRFLEGEREGLWRGFDAAGRPMREATYRAGMRIGEAFDRAVAGQYRDPAIAGERGVWDDDLAVGNWSLLDAQGRTVLRLDLGMPAEDPALERTEALADELRDAAGWGALARDLKAARRPGEALLAAARAASRGAEVALVKAALAELALPRAPESAKALAEEAATPDAPLAVLANLLVRGAAAAPVLRACAIALDQRGRPLPALDLVNAAILLDPADGRFLFTRALVLLSLGLPGAALEDAAAREAQCPEEGRFLATYARALYPRFDFWPARERPVARAADLPPGPAQAPAAVRAAFLKYVTRAVAIREAQLAWLQPGFEPDWLLPDLRGLLPKGPVRLEAFDLEVEAADGRARAVGVDERVDLEGLGLPELARLARAEWTALTWLCWASGLSEVALPRSVASPPEFGLAAGMALERLWRTRDRRITEGAMARREGIPGFLWEDTEIDLLHPGLVSMPENEYAEMAAMFRWLTGPGNRSPWQDNLRES